MQLFKDKGVKMVDTTCPWVTKVWNSVDQHSRKSYTSVIHGKYSHEETIATASFADSYVIVRDLAEAQMVVDYILNGGDREAFLKHFEKAVSKGFDPDRDLVRVGLANQVGDLLAQMKCCCVGVAIITDCCLLDHVEGLGARGTGQPGG
jgi:4-hydroxy-3-methylbut-2-enyl diphosphate reductase